MHNRSLVDDPYRGQGQPSDKNMSLETFANQLDDWGATRTPFFFAIDFEMKHPVAFTLDRGSEHFLFNINGVTNHALTESHGHSSISLARFPLSFTEYEKKFNVVMKGLSRGDSYLSNLTVRTPVTSGLTLVELYQVSQAKYKVLCKENFLVFSPETFVRIEDGKISAYPMKGTIDASIRDARRLILEDKKELAEHVTIVDLIRNDLSMIAGNVRVERFRYIDEIRTSEKSLLQVSSEITGHLPDEFRLRFGSVLTKLLPAGSVSGAPKAKTVEILRDAEGADRGYYTGVCGVFDGKVFDSGVMIRFIEQHGDKLYYRSGGGITTQSLASDEYQEVINKIYVPLD